MNIGVLGPGGVGGLIAGLLEQAGTPVVVVAREPTAEVISAQGLRVDSVSFGEFVVHPRATKTQIRHAIEEIFKVNVTKVNTVNVRGKARNFARRGVKTSGKQSDTKKAVVTLKPGQKIELGGVNYFEQ